MRDVPCGRADRKRGVTILAGKKTSSGFDRVGKEERVEQRMDECIAHVFMLTESADIWHHVATATSSHG